MLLHGELDQRVTVADATRIFENLLGKKQWRVFPFTGHGALAVDDGAEWRESVSRFLEGDR
ncbi:MAG: prolyl oligopeptidase family serine peptidase [Leptolyngbyaceae cyanobacterium CSU_1_4]|nr:prolyl oligopeptidase family serine peptidase [Leptolyngbyaceae cyanobacterium CSU_1_4]